MIQMHVGKRLLGMMLQDMMLLGNHPGMRFGH